MILSLFVYILLAFSLWFLAQSQLAFHPISPKGTRPFWTSENILAFLLFAAIYGMRYHVGVDNEMYINCYEALLQNNRILRDSFEPGYNFVSDVFAVGGFHYSFFIGFWGLLQIGLLYYSQRKNQYLLPYIALFIVLGPIWLTWANIMRQCVVECVFILSIELILNRKLWAYVGVILLGTLIHKSAIILLPFYFILRKPLIPQKRWILIGILLACTAVGMTPSFMHLMKNVEVVLAYLSYDDYVNNFQQILEDADNSRAWGPARAGTFILYLITIWEYPRLSKKFLFSQRFDIYFMCFFYGRCLYELFANTSQIFLRPITYFMDFYVVVVPICLYFLKKENRQLLFMIMSILAYTYTIYWVLKAFQGGGLGEKAPEVYKFFFLQ